MNLTFLGTGAGIPSKKRNVTAIILNLLSEINELWLFDCGEATQHQLLHTSVKPRKISKIFITHLHGDHIFGLPGLLSSRSFLGGEDPVEIYGPAGIKKFIETSLAVSKTHVSYPIVYHEMDKAGKVLENETFKVDSVSLDHGIPSFGFRIKEKDRLGELKADRLKALGIEPGPIYQQIKQNEITLLPDGTAIHRNDFIGENKQGKQIAIFGDTRYIEEHAAFIHDSDVLVHEATFSKDEAELAFNYGHSTTEQAALLAKNSQTKALIMTHISSRYQGEDTDELLEEAKAIFPDVYIAKDFYTHEIK